MQALQLQQGDVLLFQTNDDGEIIVENGLVQMASGLDTAAYLSLFGGNEEDTGTVNDANTWWCNRIEDDEVKKYRALTQHILRSLPATSANLIKLENAAKKDLKWMLTEGVANEIIVSARIPNINRVQVLININARAEQINLKFTTNWNAAL